MAQYSLRIVQSQNSQQFMLSSEQMLKIAAEANTQYQIFDEQGNLISHPRSELIGDDLHIFLDDGQAELILQDYRDYLAISDAATLKNLHSTFALSEASVSAAPLLASQVSGASLGIAAAVGVVAAVVLSSNKKGKSQEYQTENFVDEPKQQPENNGASKAEEARKEAEELDKNLPKIVFDNITEDNIINLSESQATLVVIGTVANSKTGDVLTVTIGTASQTVAITDGKFSLNLDGKTLIVHNEISASLTQNGKAIDTVAHTYQVDTDIATPTINFNNITNDNVINLKESEGKITVSGTVENAKDGDEITLLCGCPTCTGVEWWTSKRPCKMAVSAWISTVRTWWRTVARL